MYVFTEFFAGVFQEVAEKFKASKDQFPKILTTDPAIKDADPKVGDMIRITRKSELGSSIYYRVVIE